MGWSSSHIIVQYYLFHFLITSDNARETVFLVKVYALIN